VAIRPEELTLGDSQSGVNTIAGRVENVEYCGRDSLVDIVTASGALLHARSARPVTLGENVRVHVPVERALVYPA
jgi:ABC-type sugar transport system ATPase subunit